MSFGVFVIILIILSAISLFLLVKFTNKEKSYIVSFLQFFFGYLFIVSGFVKAVDPLGNSYKMEEYFQEFQSLFEPTWFSFLVPMFKVFEHASMGFGNFMIILEIVLGVMLLIGFKPKLTAWLVFLVMAFFTVLTGFTYLTGYVPMEANFFQFSKWGEFAETNMKVTDCGCFGDFIKFTAWQTFLKNMIMIIPVIYLIWKNSKMHQFGNPFLRWTITLASIVGFYLFILSNYSWGLPMVDFRPFKEGVNIREQQQLEQDALANIEEKSIVIFNKDNGKTITIPAQQYYDNIDEYSTSSFEIKDRIFSEPTVKETEISDFYIEDMDGNDSTIDLLSNPDYSFMIVSWRFPGEGESSTKVVKDTLFRYDTIRISDTIFVDGVKPYINTDSFNIVKSIDTVVDKTIDIYNYIWDADFMKVILKYINPLVNDAIKDNKQIFFITSANYEMIEDFISDGGPNIKYYNSDDITLKTIVRSNPGIVLLKDGKIIKKWHYKKLPEYSKIKSEYMSK
ncbi:MAG: DoxX family protein [Saprospiraceae bacterium]